MHASEITDSNLVEHRDLYVLAGREKKMVHSLAIASTVYRDYIEKNDLGASQAKGGGVFDASGKKVAMISYNGRVWSA